MKTEFRIFVVNPGSTSTKVSLFENETCVIKTDVFHDSPVLMAYPTINDQLEYRMKVVRDFLAKNHIDLTGIDAIVGRGGGCCPVEGGTYTINEALIKDTKEAKGGLYHSSMLGVQMAYELWREYGGQLFMIDPPVVDELEEEARLTGVQGIYRTAISHALNLKATCRVHAGTLGKRYEDLNLIACHIDGGISVTAHRKGRMIDGNDAGGGEGPFSPTRMGSMAVTDVNRYLREKSETEIRDLCSQAGGLTSWFGTSNSDTVHRLVEQGDRKAVLVWKAMLYQCAKWIGAMAAVLGGKVDGIVLTGGLLRFKDVGETIRDKCGWIAPVTEYPGEFEHEAMALGALRVLTGEEEAKIYTGEPVWKGFEFEQK